MEQGEEGEKRSCPFYIKSICLNRRESMLRWQRDPQHQYLWQNGVLKCSDQTLNTQSQHRAGKHPRKHKGHLSYHNMHFSNLSLTTSNDQFSKTYPDNLLQCFTIFTYTNCLPLSPVLNLILFSAIPHEVEKRYWTLPPQSSFLCMFQELQVCCKNVSLSQIS